MIGNATDWRYRRIARRGGRPVRPNRSAGLGVRHPSKAADRSRSRQSGAVRIRSEAGSYAPNCLSRNCAFRCLIAVSTGFFVISLAEIEGALGVTPLPNWLAGIDAAISVGLAYWLVHSKEIPPLGRDPWWSTAFVGGLLLSHTVSREVGSHSPATGEPIYWIGAAVMLVAGIGLLYRGRAGGPVAHNHSPDSPKMLAKGDLHP